MPGIQAEPFLPTIEDHVVRLGAERSHFQLVFYPEHGFAGVDKGPKGRAFIILETLLI